MLYAVSRKELMPLIKINQNQTILLMPSSVLVFELVSSVSSSPENNKSVFDPSKGEVKRGIWRQNLLGIN
jgi:hypothetical protein